MPKRKASYRRRAPAAKRMVRYRRPVTRRRSTGRTTRNIRIGGYLGIESKFLDCAWNAVTLASSADGSGGELQPSSGCTGCLSCPAQGDGESNRDGRQYCITSCFVSGVIDNTVLTDQDDSVDKFGYFIALVLDTSANGATINSEDVYINPSSSTAPMLPTPLRNLQNSKRFRILDRVYVEPGGLYSINDAAATGSIAVQSAPSFKLSWKGKILCECTGTTADVASVADNALHLVGYSVSEAFTTTIIAKSRIRFVG